MSREKYSFEYVIGSSPNILYKFLVTPSGLAQWFAHHVKSRKNVFSFFWDGYEEEAILLEKESRSFVRFQMEENEEGEFLEFRITKSPVTGDTILTVTGFADDDEVGDQKILWDRQISRLIARVGGRL